MIGDRSGDLGLDGGTRLYGIIGHPIAQVQSPQVLTPRLRRGGRNAVLLPFHVLPDQFEATTRALMQLGNLDGLVITVPYKARAINLADEVRPGGRQVGAINALRRTATGWQGDIFDGTGFVSGLLAAGFSIPGARVKILGCGGAGCAVAVALAAEGAASLALHDLDPARAQALSSRIATYFPGCHVVVDPEPADVAQCTLLVNCTPIGMKCGDGMPVAFGRLPSSLFVVDVIMEPAATPLLDHASACGCRVMNGRPMLAGQADAVIDFFDGKD